MGLEPLVQLKRNMPLGDLTEAAAENFNLIEWLLQGGLDELNIRRITAEKIFTGTLDAGKVTINVDYASGAKITIDKNGMIINDGTKDTFHVDINGQVTMTGAQVQSAAGTYPRIELSSSDELLRASLDADHYIYITPDFVGGTPALVWQDPASSMQMFIAPNGTGDFIMNPTQKIRISSSSNDVHLECATGRKISVNSWNELYNRFNSISMQTELNNLQSQINSLSTRVSALEAAP